MSEPIPVPPMFLIPEPEETVRAIHRGDVDALVVQGRGGLEIVTLSGADEPYRVLVERMSEGALTVGADGTVLFGNGRLAEMAGRPLEDIIGRPFAALFVGEVPQFYRVWTAPPEGGVRHEVNLARADGPLPVSVWAGSIALGDMPATLVTITDLSLQRRAEEIAVAERFARSILEQAADPILVLDAGGRIVRASLAAEQLSSVPPIGRQFSEAFRLEAAEPQQEALLPQLAAETFDRLLATRAFHGAEVRLSGGEALGRTFLLSAGPLLDDSKRPVGSIVTLTDITARKRAEEQQAMMIAELNHRVKNILAIVQSLADQTARRSGSLSAFQEGFGGRLRALSTAHDALTRTRWSGIELADLLREALAPYGERVHLNGTPVVMPSQAIVPVSMVLHELMTNAAKYGALSGSGNVRIDWRMDDSPATIQIDWLERDGPALQDRPRAGFGTTLIRRVVEQELEGTCRLEFEKAGLHCSVRFPLPDERPVVWAPALSPSGNGGADSAGT